MVKLTKNILSSMLFPLWLAKIYDTADYLALCGLKRVGFLLGKKEKS